MATLFLPSVADTWPVGTSVGAYLESNWLTSQLPPSGAAQGAAAASGTVAADGSLTISGLADGTRYFVGADVSPWKYRRASTPFASSTVENATVRVSGTASRNGMPTGAKIQNIDRLEVPFTNTGGLTSGTLRVGPLGTLLAGHSLSWLKFMSQGTAAATPTNQWAGLVRASDLTLLAVSADKLTEAWSTNAVKQFDLASAYSPASDEFLLYCLNVTAATVPTLNGISHTSSTVQTGVAPAMNGSSTTGLTSPLTVGTTLAAITGLNTQAWCWAG